MKDIDPYRFRNLNPVNELVTEEHLNNIFKKFKIDAEIKDLSIYQSAFVHTTYLKPTDTTDPLAKEEYNKEIYINPYLKNFNKESGNWVDFQPDSYERLEILGDAVLGSIITSYIFHRYPDEREGFITKLKTQLVRGTNLAILARKLKFDRYVLISRKAETAGLRKNNAVLEDVLEAFIGALFLDFGGHANPGPAFGICYKFVIILMERYLNMNQMARRHNNYKDLLMQYYHKHFNGENPKYKQISVYGPSSNRIFKAGVLNSDGHMITTGEGSKLVFAEQEAAKEALKYYGQDVYSDEEEADHKIYNDSDSEEL